MTGSEFFAVVMTGIAAFLLFLAILSPTEATTDGWTATINGEPCEKISDTTFLCIAK